jgi:hypothetical protein
MLSSELCTDILQRTTLTHRRVRCEARREVVSRIIGPHCRHDPPRRRGYRRPGRAHRLELAGIRDPPWEGFSAGKFVRSPLAGCAAGGALAWLGSTGRLIVDNPGVLAFAVVAIERTVGEGYKGFFKRATHAEYGGLLRKLRIPTSPALKALVGVGYFAAVYGLFRLLARVLAKLASGSSSLTLAGLVNGLLGGLLVAVGGALKDSQFEGFIPLKFIRSPIAGALSGALFVHFSASPILVVLSTIGGERVAVECYKTFYRRQVRGMFEGQAVRHPAWMERRWMFATTYAVAVVSSILLLLG